MHFPEDETLVVDREDIPETSEDKPRRLRCLPVFGQVNQDLLVCKAFYFLFYGAYGSLFPLLAVYFKQIGLSPFEIGILIGIRPFVEFCAAPVWGGLADTYKKAKIILLLSLFSWLVFTESMAFVKPGKPSCVEYSSVYDDVLVHPLPIPPPPERDSEPHQPPGGDLNLQVEPPNDEKVKNRKPFHYNEKRTRKTFLILLFLVVVGEFFCSPTHTLTDSATLSYLGREKMQFYGRQRMFGSLGWGLSMLFMGLLLDRTSVTRIGCETGTEVVTRNYVICFGSFAVLITAAFLVATQFRFRYHTSDEEKNESSELKNAKGDGGDDKTKLTDADYGALHETAPENVNETPFSDDTDQDTRKDSVRDVLRMYASVRYGSVLFVAWFAGFGMGLLFAFLYWHLEELGSPALLFGLAAVVNHSSEVLTYFFSNTILSSIGHIRALCIGLACYAFRCLAISVLYNPWWVLAIETLQGLTHALIWAAATSFLGQAVRQSLRSSAQGILQGTHHGLGRGCGAIFGGLLVNAYGTEWTFRGFGLASLLVLVFIIIVQSPLLLGEEAEILTDIGKVSFRRAAGRTGTPANTPVDEKAPPIDEADEAEDRERATGDGYNEDKMIPGEPE